MAALTMAAFTSCQKDEFAASGRGGTKAIRISQVQTAAPATKAADVENATSVVKSDAYEFTFQRTAKPFISGVETKADQKNAGNLLNFNLYGYLDAAQIDKAPAASEADKANKNFISGASVSKDGSVWHTDTPYYWRNMINHYFWAQSGLSAMTADASSASFDYTGDDDVIVAYAQKYWDESKTDELNLNFKHAMSAVKFNLGTISYRQKDGTDAQSGRVKTDKIEFISAASGHCDVSSDLAFDWSNKGVVKSKTIADGELNFAIPQNTAQMQVYFTDTYRTVTRPVMIPLNENWAPGTEYDYTANGTITVPTFSGDNPPVDPGLNLNFDAKDNRSEVVVTSLDVTFYKQLKITWDALPNTTGNGTYAFVYVGTGSKEPFDKKEVNSYIANNDFLFVYDAFQPQVLKGNVPPGTDHCSCVFDIPDSMTGKINLYFAYLGGAGNASTQWHVKNLNIQVTEYKGITPTSL